MPKKQDYLEHICLDLYKQNEQCKHSKPNADDFQKNGNYDVIAKMYADLGGIADEVPLNAGAYDIELDKCIIEFDEENHFNRYRLKTLSSPIYKNWNYFNVADYEKYCKRFEDKCRKYSKFWRTDSSDRQYGESSIEGVLEGAGSSRWKQRAFYDFVKDVYSITVNIPIIRISIYDIYHGQTISDLIKEHREEKLKQYIKSRVDSL